MTDVEEEGVWRWVDGQLVDMDDIDHRFNNIDGTYAIGDSRRTNADCGRIGTGDNIHDNNCEREAFFVCGMNN